jgi:uncharacterized membrane protein YgcG
LVFALVGALLLKTKVLGDNKVIPWFIAAMLGLLTLLSEDVVKLINFMSPWFVVVFIFLILLVLTYRLFGVTEQNIVDYMINDRTINWALLAIGLAIIGGGIFNVFGERALEATEGGEISETGFETNLFKTLFSPKILGLILIFGIAIFTIGFLGGGGSESGGGGGGHH